MPPRLPASVTTMLAARNMRSHHATWHFVRSRWHAMSAAERQQFAAWKPPRLTPVQFQGEPPAPPRDPGAGIDFLYMHRRMIASVNALLAHANDAAYPRVTGWNPIPWAHDDAEWPMPAAYPESPPWAKDPSETAFWKNEAGLKFENPGWLARQSLDALGSEIEEGIHNWLHMHWAAMPWYTEGSGRNPDDPRNDYLGDPYSSHVNPAFWKLHGWIDDRITAWERASGRVADLSAGWEGPVSHDHHMMADEKPGAFPTLSDTQRREARALFSARTPRRGA